MSHTRSLNTVLLFALSLLATTCFAGEKNVEGQVSKATSRSQYMVVHGPKKGDDIKGAAGIVIVESFSAPDRTFTVFNAATLSDLKNYLQANAITPIKITQIRDINSPVRGGGLKAGDQPRQGHQVFVIERGIPGVGNFPDKKKMAISRKSNRAIAEIGNSIEWDHSYLTDEGTYCIYRATDESTIRQHGKIAGAPIVTIYGVKKTSVSKPY